jgi:hypothetical protein
VTGGFSQNTVTGQVFKASDSTTIAGASVYFDGTSQGVSTTNAGAFELLFKENNSLLVISSLGYESIAIDINTAHYRNKFLNIYMDEKLEELEAVQLELDTWSRAKKLNVFRNQFIGLYTEGASCKIMNEEVIKLKYMPSSKTLVAWANEPLIIKNKHLGYKITYNLTDFEVNYIKSKNGFTMHHKTYYEGYSFFESLKKKTSKKTLNNRSENYLGSSLHFFRAAFSKSIAENDFKIFYEKFQVPTYKYLSIKAVGSRKKVELLVDKIVILYKDASQSSFSAKGVFFIDIYGNHSPPDAVILSGNMSNNRIANLLPLDYFISYLAII